MTSVTRMQNIAIVVEDEPTPAQLAEVDLEPPDTLLGLYEGTPLTERQWAHGNALPDKITLFQAAASKRPSDDERTRSSRLAKHSSTRSATTSACPKRRSRRSKTVWRRHDGDDATKKTANDEDEDGLEDDGNEGGEKP